MTCGERGYHVINTNAKTRCCLECGMSPEQYNIMKYLEYIKKASKQMKKMKPKPPTGPGKKGC